MSTRPQQTADSAKKLAQRRQALSGEEVKTQLRERGETLKSWAEKHKFPYATVSQVVRGVNRGTFGMGHRIATALGMK